MKRSTWDHIRSHKEGVSGQNISIGSFHNVSIYIKWLQKLVMLTENHKIGKECSNSMFRKNLCELRLWILCWTTSERSSSRPRVFSAHHINFVCVHWPVESRFIICLGRFLSLHSVQTHLRFQTDDVDILTVNIC